MADLPRHDPGDWQTVLDHLEAAWTEWASDTPDPGVGSPAGVPYSPQHVMFTVGQVIESHRPGLVDRFAARLHLLADERRLVEP